MIFAITKLDAINLILSSIGSDPVNSLTDSTDVDVINAVKILENTSRDIQRKGWDFNRGTYTLQPDVITNKIRWDANIISYTSTDGNTYVKRGNYLYDMTNKTFEFNTTVELEVVMTLDFDDLPDCFKNYVAKKAAISFQIRYMGDATVTQYLQMELQEAYQELVDYDMNMEDYNMLQLTNVSEVLQRT